MSKKKTEIIENFFDSYKEQFIMNWEKKVKNVLKQTKNEQMEISPEEFERLYDAYISDLFTDNHHESHSIIMDIIKTKFENGFLLSTLEFINASFMATARELFRQVYPDAFDRRMEYLEHLSQMILNNEVKIAEYYENYLNDLNQQLVGKAEALKRHNSALVEFVDLATHQLQSPLWSILGFVSKLQKKYYEIIDVRGRHYLDRITANVSDMHQLIEDVTAMLVIAQADMVEREVFLQDLIQYSLKKVCEEIDEQFSCALDIPEHYLIKGDPYHLKQVFYQIFKNSAQFTNDNDSGKVRLYTAFNSKFSIFIEDDGIGIEPRYRDLVMKPMERLREKDVSGSGMGLTFVNRIMESHGGSILLKDPQEYKGICIVLEFPGDIVRKIEIDKKE
ncbi:MAG: HAMP domain-containing histidine kinase [Spirochaetales bacterium]|nr:HAMP domain-containing histidine kinase [Spirochaetales bacterium]